MTSPSPAWPDAPEIVVDPREEAARVDDLRALNLLDSQPEYRFDRITRLAADFFHVPIAYIALIDDHRQWLKSRVGLVMDETPARMTFCQYTIHRNEPFIIRDTLADEIGRSHPLVVGEPHVRFYAGVPLAGPSGKKIGTLCLVDFAPRAFTEQDLASLLAFASLVEREINLGEIIQTQNELLQIRKRLLETQHELEQEFADAARYVRTMLPPPLDGVEKVDWVFDPSLRLGGDGLGYRRINEDLLAVYILDVTGHGLGSALLAVTTMELLRNPAAQLDFSRPSIVIDRLNRTFPMKSHGGKFFSAWYGVYSRSRQTITYANGGHPPAVLFARENGHAVLRRTAPGTSVLGVLPEVDTTETTIAFPPGMELLLFSDGLYELNDPKGGHGSYDEFFAYLQAQADGGTAPWEAIRHWHAAAQERKQVDDDVTMLRFGTKGRACHQLTPWA